MTSNFYVSGAAATTSNRDDWETPQALFDFLDERYHFTLDAFSSHENAKCAKHYTEEEDGLERSWKGETAFCNPPYGRDMARYVGKCAWEWEVNGTRSVLLVPARTDTRWFHEYIVPNARVEFVRGRLKFETDGVAGESSPFPSMLCFFGEEPNVSAFDGGWRR